MTTKGSQKAALLITVLPDNQITLRNIEEIIDRETKSAELLKALKDLLEAYAPGADGTAKWGGEDALHSSVRDARALIRELDNT